MTREELAAARDLLESAAADTSDEAARDRLDELAGQLDHLSTADRGPDHGRLARIQSALNELETVETAAAIEDADDAIDEYRSDLEGV